MNTDKTAFQSGSWLPEPRHRPLSTAWGLSVSICVHLWLASFLFASLVVASTLAVAQDRPSQPEPPSGWTPKSVAHAKRYMVAAANPLAVEAGLRMLERGGNAIDAMVAVQLALNLVEPSS